MIVKASDIVDAAIEIGNGSIEVEMPNGSRVVTRGYTWGENKRGQPVLVILAGKDRKLK